MNGARRRAASISDRCPACNAPIVGTSANRPSLSRSARNCFSIASMIDFGGSMALSSTRFTRMPQLPVAAISGVRSVPALISDRVGEAVFAQAGSQL